MLIDEIKSECWHVFVLIIIIAWGMFFCDVGNREVMWKEKYQNWEYNLNPQEGAGFYDAIIKP
ncbi:hypothetical protein KAR91_17265 [Candidatus Pacearchaeota archaeon]|nr:hypothetical protein [Candidatus Pacearchaeota archaeon]